VLSERHKAREQEPWAGYTWPDAIVTRGLLFHRAHTVTRFTVAYACMLLVVLMLEASNPGGPLHSLAARTSLPIAAGLPAIGLIGYWVWCRRLRRYLHRHGYACCPRCMYPSPQSGTPEAPPLRTRCPECGHTCDAAHAANAWARIAGMDPLNEMNRPEAQGPDRSKPH